MQKGRLLRFIAVEQQIQIKSPRSIMHSRRTNATVITFNAKKLF